MKIYSVGPNLIIQEGDQKSSFARNVTSVSLDNGIITITNGGVAVKTISNYQNVTLPLCSSADDLANRLMFIISIGNTFSDMIELKLSDYEKIADATQLMSDIWLAVNSKASITSVKRQEAYSGVTNASGIYTASFPTEFPVAPNIQANIINGTNTQTSKIAVTKTGFTITIVNRVDVVGLLPSYVNVSGAAVDVLVTAK